MRLVVKTQVKADRHAAGATDRQTGAHESDAAAPEGRTAEAPAHPAPQASAGRAGCLVRHRGTQSLHPATQAHAPRSRATHQPCSQSQAQSPQHLYREQRPPSQSLTTGPAIPLSKAMGAWTLGGSMLRTLVSGVGGCTALQVVCWCRPGCRSDVQVHRT